jgi:hypothetical protein
MLVEERYDQKFQVLMHWFLRSVSQETHIKALFNLFEEDRQQATSYWLLSDLREAKHHIPFFSLDSALWKQSLIEEGLRNSCARIFISTSQALCYNSA